MHIRISNQELMETNEENPVITRLKTFMTYTGLTNSQFADTATIPRPTLSQLLHGRNKSISDQLLKKLHDTFPILDISWLLFGSGNMLTDPNFETSEVQNLGQATQNTSKSTEIQGVFNLAPDKRETVDEPFIYRNYTSVNQNSTGNRDDRDIGETLRSKEEESITNKLSSIGEGSEGTAKGKKIKSIIVFYQDSSFEVFSPSDTD